MRTLFESIPILLAVLSMFYSIRAALLTEKNKDRYIFLTTALSALLLILAQSSWAWSVSHQYPIGQLWADNIWTIFNTLVMCVHISLAIRSKS